jgi:hypothetical protein
MKKVNAKDAKNREETQRITSLRSFARNFAFFAFSLS